MLDPQLELGDLHIHVGGAVAPHILWSIAHEQGFKLPVQTYWEFRDLVTAQPGQGRLAGRLPGHPAPLDREDSVVAGGHRALGLRDHRQGVPLQPGHAARAALQPDEAQPGRRARPRPHHPRGAARAWIAPSLEYGSRVGLIFCLAREFPIELNEILVKKAIKYRARGRGGHRPGRARSNDALELGPQVDAYAELFARARGRRAGGHHPHRRDAADRRRAGCWRCSSAGGRRASATASPPPAARRPCASWSSASTVLEICPSSNLRTRVVSGLRRAAAASCARSASAACPSPSTPTGPTCSNTHLRQEFDLLLDGRRPDRAQALRCVETARARHLHRVIGESTAARPLRL